MQVGFDYSQQRSYFCYYFIRHWPINRLFGALKPTVDLSDNQLCVLELSAGVNSLQLQNLATLAAAAAAAQSSTSPTSNSTLSTSGALGGLASPGNNNNLFNFTMHSVYTKPDGISCLALCKHVFV